MLADVKKYATFDKAIFVKCKITSWQKRKVYFYILFGGM
jgi:hypothetical protein